MTLYNGRVSGPRPIVLAVSFLIAASVAGCPSPAPAQLASPKDPSTLPPEEEKESYDIYSTLLRIKEPNVKAWMIVQQTRAFELCLKPALDQEPTYRPMIADYAQKNKTGFVLERKFELPEYTLVPPEAWTRSSALSAFAVVSAVGFNRGRTRAAVCLWGRDSGTCYFLIKKSDAWRIDLDWRGTGCGWAA